MTDVPGGIGNPMTDVPGGIGNPLTDVPGGIGNPLAGLQDVPSVVHNPYPFVVCLILLGIGKPLQLFLRGITHKYYYMRCIFN